MSTQDAVAVTIPLRWVPVVLSNGKRFNWHRERALADADRRRLDGARVYRWILRDVDGKIERVYIGESGAFEERITQYRSDCPADGTTEATLRAEMNNCEVNHGSVDLEFLSLETPISINGKMVNNYALGERNVRLMMENIAIVTAKAQGLKLVNRLGENIIETKLLALLQKVIGEEGHERTMEILKARLGMDFGQSDGARQ